MAGGIPASKIRERNEERINYLRQHFDEIEIFWECEIQQMLAENVKIIRSLPNATSSQGIREFFDDLPDTGLINLHDAFFG